MKINWMERKGDVEIEDGTYRIIANPKTDLFIDPRNGPNPMNVPWLLLEPAVAFTLSAKVQAELTSTYAAGGLILYQDDANWAKLCLEVSPLQEIISVSVITPGHVSDDCVHEYLDGHELDLRISTLGNQAYAFHTSTDGKTWKFMRYFGLPTQQLRVGLMSQCPHGDSHASVFTEVSYAEEGIPDMRSGS